jgi:hypothetical protein
MRRKPTSAEDREALGAHPGLARPVERFLLNIIGLGVPCGNRSGPGGPSPRRHIYIRAHTAPEARMTFSKTMVDHRVLVAFGLRR